jgi:hypothetical protein
MSRSRVEKAHKASKLFIFANTSVSCLEGVEKTPSSSGEGNYTAMNVDESVSES